MFGEAEWIKQSSERVVRYRTVESIFACLGLSLCQHGFLCGELCMRPVHPGTVADVVLTREGRMSFSPAVTLPITPSAFSADPCVSHRYMSRAQTTQAAVLVFLWLILMDRSAWSLSFGCVLLQTANSKIQYISIEYIWVFWVFLCFKCVYNIL